MDRVIDPRERWEQLQDFFHRLSELPQADRASTARQWCADDSELLTSLLDMLTSDAEVKDLLASPAEIPDDLLQRPADDSGTAWDSASTESAETAFWIGKQLGPFQIDHILGQGGMGVVYLAHRVNGTFEQSVAIKLIARHLRYGPAVHQFNLERNALAALEHQNIARLIDAGVTKEGTPFVAMEYIEGRRLDTVSDDTATSLHDKLRLMIQLCDAVSYVHRNLILHRDLKPGNVMVTGDNVIKLLDFGTLKLLGPAADISSEMTQAGMRPVTLRYASPEHIQGKTLSTSTDVYSLGMTLYRMLAGRLPPVVNGLSIEDHLAVIRDTPLAPLSEVRGDSGHPLDRDLNAIIAKAIRFEPEMRYISAEALAADLVRCLEQKPVEARRGNWRYRTGKFYRRHRWPILATAAILVVLATGLTLIQRQAGIERREQQRADLGIEQERGLAHFLFRDYFEELKDIPGSTAAQRAAVVEALSYLDRLAKIADNQGLRLETMEAYRRMALLQGDPYEQNLGDPQGALQSLSKALALADSVSKSHRDTIEMLSARALLVRTFSEIYYGLGDTQQAVDSMRTAVSLYDTIVRDPAVKASHFQLASNAYNGLADELGQPNSSSLGDKAGALTAYQHDIELSQSALRLQPGSSLSLQSIALAHDKIGQLMMSTDPAAAIEAFKRSLADRQVGSAATRNAFRNRRGEAINLLDLGDALNAARDYPEAIEAHEKARSTFENFSAADPKDVRAKHDLAVALAAEADDYVDQLSPQLNARLNPEPVVPGATPPAPANERASSLLQESINILETIATTDSAPHNWKVLLAYDKVRLGSLRYQAHQDSSGKLAAEGLKGLRVFIHTRNLTIEELEWITNAELNVEPAKLRDNHRAQEDAERLVALDHGTDPGTLALLVLACQANGEQTRAKKLANRALALMPPTRTGERTTRTRKLLESTTVSLPS